jgi:hypothetical protein
MKLIVAGICIVTVFGQVSTVAAGDYYYFGTGAIARADLTPVDLGWLYTRNQPVGYDKPYPALRMADGTLACSNSNYRPTRGGWCRRIW